MSRQHADKGWSETARKIRELINAAIQDMPEHPGITKLLAGTCKLYVLFTTSSLCTSLVSICLTINALHVQITLSYIFAVDCKINTLEI